MNLNNIPSIYLILNTLEKILNISGKEKDRQKFFFYNKKLVY